METNSKALSVTLLAPVGAGGSLGMRLWSPRKSILARKLVSSIVGLFILLLWGCLMLTRGAVGWASTALFLPPTLVLELVRMKRWIHQLRRPSCVMTASEGVLLTNRAGSRLIPWSYIESAELIRKRYGTDFLLLTAPDRIQVDLAGYATASQCELLEHFVRRTGLIRDPAKLKRYVSSVRPLPARGSIQALELRFRARDDGAIEIASLNNDVADLSLGLKMGDELIEINGLPGDSITLEQANAETRGPAGSMIKLTVRRGADPELLHLCVPIGPGTSERHDSAP